MEDQKIIKKIEELRDILHELDRNSLNNELIKERMLLLKDTVDLITEIIFPERWEVMFLGDNIVRYFTR